MINKKIILSLTFFMFCYPSFSSDIENLILPESFKISLYAEDVKSDCSLLISDDKANVVYWVTYSPDLI
jgi:hypothetical protein